MRATSQALGLEERLALFLQVLDALKYAHEKLVIHRDLKPSDAPLRAATNSGST